MGTPGSVNYLFERKAIFQFDKYSDELIDYAISNECLDIVESNGSVTFEFNPSDFKKINEGLKDLEFIVSNAEIAYIPNVGVNITADQLKSISKIIDSLEELDDVQEVFTNFDIEENELETLLSE